MIDNDNNVRKYSVLKQVDLDPSLYYSYLHR